MSLALIGPRHVHAIEDVPLLIVVDLRYPCPDHPGAGPEHATGLGYAATLGPLPPGVARRELPLRNS